MPIKVFISYSHKDDRHRSDLEEHLSMLQQNSIIDTWNDRKIISGEDWAKEISENLNQSDLILFLVSSSFFGF